jgi:hypothetical protein
MDEREKRAKIFLCDDFSALGALCFFLRFYALIKKGSDQE